MEEIQTAAYADVVAGSDTRSLGGEVFERSWVVTEDEPIPKVKAIVLEASWEERGQDFTVRTTTLRSAE